MDAYQFLGVADPEFAGHEFGEEGVTQGGEGARLLDQNVNRSPEWLRDPLKAARKPVARPQDLVRREVC
jgi:hypothetical protein